MFLSVLKSEIKNIVRDRMNTFFVIYPVILAVVGVYLIPYIRDHVPEDNASPEIVAIMFIIMIGFIFGAVTGFTLLNDKDDKVLISLKITPISVRAYVISKLIISYLFGVFATILITLATNLVPDATFWEVILISLIGGIQAPIIALFINSFATNKVEGFVIMKGTGFILILPIASFFLTDWKEFLFVIAPGFWPARMIQMKLMPGDYNLSFYLYFIVGVVFNLIIAYLVFKLYTKKNNI